MLFGILFLIFYYNSVNIITQIQIYYFIEVVKSKRFQFFAVQVCQFDVVN